MREKSSLLFFFFFFFFPLLDLIYSCQNNFAAKTCVGLVVLLPDLIVCFRNTKVTALQCHLTRFSMSKGGKENEGML